MIEKIRKPGRSRSYFNYLVYAIIFGMIIATFIFMIPGITGQGGGVINVAAEVGGNSISLKDYSSMAKRVRAQYQSMMGGQPLPDFLEERVKRESLERLVQEEVIRQYAQKEGIVVSDLEVADFIKKDIPGFQSEEGQFDSSKYNTYLSYERKTPYKFEQEVKKNILLNKVMGAFRTSLSSPQIEKDFSDQSKQVSIAYKTLILDKEQIQKNTKVSQAQIESFMKTPEAQKELKEFYDLNKSNYKLEDQAEVSFILIKDESKAKELFPKINKDNFEEMASVHSEDPISKTKGGHLGFVKRGQYPAPIEQAMFATAIGEVSQPVKTEQGQALLLVKGKRLNEFKKFEEHKNLVASDFLKKQSYSAFKTKLVEDLAQNKNASEQLLSNAGLKWSNSKNYNIDQDQFEGTELSDEDFMAILKNKKGSVLPQIKTLGGKEALVKVEAVKELSKTEAKSPNSPMGRDLSNRFMATYYEMYQKERQKLGVQENQSIVAK